MPIDELAGEVVGAAVEFMGDVLLDGAPRRSRFRRLLHWSILALLGGALLVVAYLALS